LKTNFFLAFLTLFLLVACAPTESVPQRSTPTPGLATLAGTVIIAEGDPQRLLEGAPTPNTPPSEFEARTLQIFNTNGAELLYEVPINGDGTFSIDIPPGTYFVNLAPFGIDVALDLPTVVVLAGGLTRELDIIIDLGIR
jgi:hypothetical protein